MNFSSTHIRIFVVRKHRQRHEDLAYCCRSQKVSSVWVATQFIRARVGRCVCLHECVNAKVFRRLLHVCMFASVRFCVCVCVFIRCEGAATRTVCVHSSHRKLGARLFCSRKSAHTAKERARANTFDEHTQRPPSCENVRSGADQKTG